MRHLSAIAYASLQDTIRDNQGGEAFGLFTLCKTHSLLGNYQPHKMIWTRTSVQRCLHAEG